MRHRSLILALAVILLGFALAPSADPFWERSLSSSSFLVDVGLVSSAPISPNVFEIVGQPLWNLGGMYAILALQILLCVIAYLLWNRLDLPGAVLASWLLPFSPWFVAAFASVSDAGFYMVLIITSLWLLQTKAWPLAIFLNTVVGLRSWVDCVAFALIVLLTAIISKQMRRGVITLIPLLAVGLWHAFFIPLRIVTSRDTFLNSFFFEFGAPFGLTIATLLLGLIGAYLLWKNKGQFSLAAGSLVAFVILSLIDVRAVLYLSLCTILLSGVAAEYLLGKQWQLKRLKLVFTGFLGCIIVFGLFQALVPIEFDSSVQLDSDIVSALEWLSQQNEGVVFTHVSYANEVARLNDMKVLMVPESERVNNNQQVWLDSLQLFHAFEPNIHNELMEKYDVKYVMITSEMESGLVWQSAGRGLTYAITVNPLFDLKYENSNVRIYAR